MHVHVAGTMQCVLIKGDVLISGEIFYVAGTIHSVQIKEGVLISGVVWYTSHSVLIKGGVLIIGLGCVLNLIKRFQQSQLVNTK